MSIEVVDEHVRGGGDADLKVGFLLVAECEWLAAVAVRGDEDGLADCVPRAVHVGHALAEVADGRAAARAGCFVALGLHDARVAAD